MKPIMILVGTMSGNAEFAAAEMEQRLKKRGIPSNVRDMSECTLATISPERTYIICTSTYGEGDVPDNAQPLYDELCNARPNLRGIRYGVVGLGDRIYMQTFNGGPKRFDAILTELGAQRIGERMEHDASSGTFADEAAGEWLETWLQLLDDGVVAPAR